MRKPELLYPCVIIFLCLCVLSCSPAKNKLTIIFDRVDNLKAGSMVYLRGVPVGEVTQLDLFGREVVVDVELKQRIQIPVDSKFFINSSILGNGSINIEPSGKTIFISAKDTVKGKYVEKKLLDDLFSDSTKSSKIQGSLDKIGEGIKELVELSKDSTNKKSAKQ